MGAADRSGVNFPVPDRPVPGQPRKWIGIHFKCCNVYGRLYKSADGRAYRGGCPKCGSQVQARVGVGGTDQRFFTAG